MNLQALKRKLAAIRRVMAPPAPPPSPGPPAVTLYLPDNGHHPPGPGRHRVGDVELVIYPPGTQLQLSPEGGLPPVAPDSADR